MAGFYRFEEGNVDVLCEGVQEPGDLSASITRHLLELPAVSGMAAGWHRLLGMVFWKSRKVLNFGEARGKLIAAIHEHYQPMMRTKGGRGPTASLLSVMASTATCCWALSPTIQRQRMPASCLTQSRLCDWDRTRGCCAGRMGMRPQDWLRRNESRVGLVYSVNAHVVLSHHEFAGYYRAFWVQADRPEEAVELALMKCRRDDANGFIAIYDVKDSTAEEVVPDEPFEPFERVMPRSGRIFYPKS